MLKIGMRVVCLVGVVLGMTWGVRAQGERRDAELEALRQRVRELEAQNRAILQMLQALKQQLAARTVQEAGEPGGETKRSGNRGGQGKGGLTSAPQGAGRGTVKWKELSTKGSRLQFYGFLRLDLIADSARPDFAQTIFRVRSADPRLGVGNRKGNFTMHPRLTRIGINYSGPEIGGGGRLTGKFEVDFQNGGRESRPRFRTRHAYVKLSWGAFSLLGGQTWDIISPLYPTVNNDTLMWNAGNLGDRRAQVRFSYEPHIGGGQFSFAGGIGLTGAIDSKDLDGDGFRDGETSRKPNLQARLGYAHALWNANSRLSVGVSGHYGWEEMVTPVAGRKSFRSQSLNVDYILALHERVMLRGEGWFGRNLSDFRGGVGQGLNTVVGTEIRSRGGWAELGIKLSRFYRIFPGYTLDDPVDRDIPVQGRIKNRAWYIVNRFYPGGPFIVGIDYLRWTTDYKGLDRGVDHRLNIYVQYNF